MLAINKARRNRVHLSPRYQGPVDSDGYTPDPKDLPDPASLKVSLAKHDAPLQKILAQARADTARKVTNVITPNGINTEIKVVRVARQAATSKR
jgi:hypothetical protein